MKRLKITAIKGTDVIQLTYEDRDATIAAAVINSIMNIYLEENVKNYRFITSNARKFVKKQIPLAEQKVEKTEMDLRQFRELNKIVSLEEEQKDSVQFLLALKNQFNTVLTQLSDTEAQLKVIQNQLGIDPEKSIDTTKANQSKGVQDLLTEKQSLEAQLANESTRYQDSHPVLQSLRSRIAALDGLLRERIAAVTQRSPADTSNIQQIGALQQDLTSQSIQLNAKRDGFASQLQTILDSEEQYKQRVNSLPKLEQQQRQLSRYLDVAQSTYTLLLKKEEELRITEDQIAGNAQIISPAIVPQELGESIRVPLILGSLILGAALGLALGYVLDSADKSLRTIEDVISAYSFPLLGEILIEENHQVMAIADENNLSPINWDKTEKEQKFVIRDAAQLLGLNLKVLNLKKSIKVIVVTSVEAKEGKSTIAAYLGASLAQLGEKVLLIDANLHSPSQHPLWNYDNHSGLSDILVNSVDADLAVVKSMPNLSLISSGTVNVSHPLAILDTLKMDSVIRNLSSQYDYVILDTPAIAVFSQ